MSIFALPADSASWLRAGIAEALISWSRGFSLGYSTAVTSETFPLVTVTRTWTGPHRVSAASPVTVFDDEPGTLGADASLPFFGAPPDVLGPVVLIAAGGFATDAECVLNDSRPTRPAIVPTMANATRRMTMSLFLPAAQNSNDSWWICRRGTSASRSAATTDSAIRSGPQTQTS